MLYLIAWGVAGAGTMVVLNITRVPRWLRICVALVAVGTLAVQGFVALLLGRSWGMSAFEATLIGAAAASGWLMRWRFELKGWRNIFFPPLRSLHLMDWLAGVVMFIAGVSQGWIAVGAFVIAVTAGGVRDWLRFRGASA